jgi:hypothetical protein
MDITTTSTVKHAAEVTRVGRVVVRRVETNPGSSR